MRRRSTKVQIIVLSILAIFILMQIIGLVSARIITPKMMKEALESELMVLKIDNLSKGQINILLLVEDPIFYSHKGIDHNSLGAGRTTISQGLVKIFYFKKFKSGIAKIRQTLIARYVFNPLVSKNDQLNLFINYVYMGNEKGKEIRGFAQASKVFFDKNFSDLTNDEYLALVAMPINPNRYGIKTNPENNENRVNRIRKLLAGECQPLNWKDCDFKGCE